MDQRTTRYYETRYSRSPLVTRARHRREPMESDHPEWRPWFTRKLERKISNPRTTPDENKSNPPPHMGQRITRSISSVATPNASNIAGFAGYHCLPQGEIDGNSTENSVAGMPTRRLSEAPLGVGHFSTANDFVFNVDLSTKANNELAPKYSALSDRAGEVPGEKTLSKSGFSGNFRLREKLERNENLFDLVEQKMNADSGSLSGDDFEPELQALEIENGENAFDPEGQCDETSVNREKIDSNVKHYSCPSIDLREESETREKREKSVKHVDSPMIEPLVSELTSHNVDVTKNRDMEPEARSNEASAGCKLKNRTPELPMRPVDCEKVGTLSDNWSNAFGDKPVFLSANKSNPENSFVAPNDRKGDEKTNSQEENSRCGTPYDNVSPEEEISEFHEKIPEFHEKIPEFREKNPEFHEKNPEVREKNSESHEKMPHSHEYEKADRIPRKNDEIIRKIPYGFGDSATAEDHEPKTTVKPTFPEPPEPLNQFNPQACSELPPLSVFIPEPYTRQTDAIIYASPSRDVIQASPANATSCVTSSVEISPNGTRRVLIVDRKIDIVVTRYDHNDDSEPEVGRETVAIPAQETPSKEYKFVFKEPQDLQAISHNSGDIIQNDGSMDVVAKCDEAIGGFHCADDRENIGSNELLVVQDSDSNRSNHEQDCHSDYQQNPDSLQAGAETFANEIACKIIAACISEASYAIMREFANSEDRRMLLPNGADASAASTTNLWHHAEDARPEQEREGNSGFYEKIPEFYAKIPEFQEKIPEFHEKIPEFHEKIPELFEKNPRENDGPLCNIPNGSGDKNDLPTDTSYSPEMPLFPGYKKRVSFSDAIREIKIDRPDDDEHEIENAPNPAFRKPISVPFEKMPGKAAAIVDNFLREAVDNTGCQTRAAENSHSAQTNDLQKTSCFQPTSVFVRKNKRASPPQTIDTKFPRNVEQTLILGSAPLEVLEETEEFYRPRSFSSNNIEILCEIRHPSPDTEPDLPITDERAICKPANEADWVQEGQVPYEKFYLTTDEKCDVEGTDVALGTESRLAQGQSSSLTISTDVADTEPRLTQGQSSGPAISTDIAGTESRLTRGQSSGPAISTDIAGTESRLTRGQSSGPTISTDIAGTESRLTQGQSSNPTISTDLADMESVSTLSPSSSLVADMLQYRREQECVEHGLSPSDARTEDFNWDTRGITTCPSENGSNSTVGFNGVQSVQNESNQNEPPDTTESLDSAPVSPASSATLIYEDVLKYRKEQECVGRGLSPSHAENLEDDFLWSLEDRDPTELPPPCCSSDNETDRETQSVNSSLWTTDRQVTNFSDDQIRPEPTSCRDEKVVAFPDDLNSFDSSIGPTTAEQISQSRDIDLTAQPVAETSGKREKFRISNETLLTSLPSVSTPAHPAVSDYCAPCSAATFVHGSSQSSMNNKPTKQQLFVQEGHQLRHRESLDDVLEYRKRLTYTSDADVVAAQRKSGHAPDEPKSSEDEDEPEPGNLPMVDPIDGDPGDGDPMDGGTMGCPPPHPDDPEIPVHRWPFNAPTLKTAKNEVESEEERILEEMKRKIPAATIIDGDGTRKKSSKVSKVPHFSRLYEKKSSRGLPGGRKDTIQDIQHTGNVEETIYTVFRDDTGLVPINRFLQAVYAVGVTKDDYRLKEMVTNMQKINKQQNGVYEPIEGLHLTKQEFAQCIQDNIVIITKVLRNKLIIPEWETFCEHVMDIYHYCEAFTDGLNAQYIEQLARVDPSIWAVSVCTVDGQRFKHGRSDEPVCIQSCSKVLNYAKALQELGATEVHKYVGQEPSGRMFNELALDYNAKPHNPLINSGAIVTSSLVEKQDRHADRYDKMLKYYRRMAGGLYVGFNNAVFLSERATADRNFALAYYMRENKCFPDGTDLNETLDLYFQMCSVELTCESASVMASTLANGGICPITDDPVLNSSSVRDVLSLMLSCGMYDYSGHFAFNIGLPAKSGVSGLILLVVPNVMGVALWSPKLDRYGNSVRGVKFCEELVKRFNFHNYDNLRWTEKKKDPRQRAVETHGQTVVNLLFSAANGDVTALRRYKLRGINLGICDYDSRTALHLAAAEGHTECVRFLLYKANVEGDPKDRWGHTPLREAEANDHPEIIEMLKQYLAGNRDDPGPGPGSSDADELLSGTEDSGVGGSPRSYYDRRRAAEQI